MARPIGPKVEVRLRPDTLDWYDKLAEKEGVDRAVILRNACEEYKQKHG